MKVASSPPPPRPPKPPPWIPRHDCHAVSDGLQAGEDLSSLAQASGWLGRLAHEESEELRSLVARESRQAAVWGEHSRPQTLLRGGAVALNGLVAAGAAWHGLELLRSPNRLKQVEGCSHLLMAAGCGLTAAHLGSGNPAAGHAAGGLLLLHGLTEVAVGGYRALHGDSWMGGVQAAHGACLVGAELVPSLALPLCAAMTVLTGIQLWQHQRGASQH